MVFEIEVVSNTPMTPIGDPEAVAITFLYQIGYLPKGYDPKTEVENVRQSVPYRLFMNCLLRRPDKAWTIDELQVVLKTSRPTVYRHLNKLKSFDIMEEVSLKGEGEEQTRKGYRLRYGNLSKAWNFVEAHVKVAVENYRKTVDHLQELVAKEQRGRTGGDGDADLRVAQIPERRK
ncbi:MAG: helix-turn-helix transcriptional regulator [Euryarchaeota archaeon]|nr:helix-turn-helix transcriptional regulator [Euryarchaeota archaeon]